MKKTALLGIIVLFALFFVIAQPLATAGTNDIIESVIEIRQQKTTTPTPGPAVLTSEQRNALAILNYLTVVSQEINASAQSRLYLEQVYDSLIDNLYPNAVTDKQTLAQVNALLDTMNKYRMIASQRERVEMTYAHQQAQTVKDVLAKLVPDTTTWTEALATRSWTGFGLTIGKSLLSNIISQRSDLLKLVSKSEDLQYLSDVWKLDDEEMEALHKSRKNAFNYMVSVIRDNRLPGELALSEEDARRYAECVTNGSAAQRIAFLEANHRVYRYFPDYWLSLAESYHEIGDYTSCLVAGDTYEALGVRLFRKDTHLVEVLPRLIASAAVVYKGDQYIERATHYIRLIDENAWSDDWFPRFFAAMTLVDMYADTGDEDDLKTASRFILPTLERLAREQRSLNAEYRAPLELRSVPWYASTETAAEIRKSNEALEKKRERELPPMYEPLVLTCDLLREIADKTDFSTLEAQTIDGILFPDDQLLFHSTRFDNTFRFFMRDLLRENTNGVSFDGTILGVPVAWTSADADIRMTVAASGAKDAKATISDWTLKRVVRTSSDDLSQWRAEYESRTVGKYRWEPGDAVIITVRMRHNRTNTCITSRLAVSAGGGSVSFRKSPLPAVNGHRLYYTENNSIRVSGYEGHYIYLSVPERVEGIPVDSIESFVYRNSGIEHVTLPKSFKEVPTGAFGNCSTLKSATLPDMIGRIGTAAFAGCTGLKTVNIPDSVEIIDISAFRDCASLTSLVLPSGVRYIGQMAFEGCTSLVLTVPPDSYALQYCIENRLNYVIGGK